jgi:phosphate transport system substrate-binding protein
MFRLRRGTASPPYLLFISFGLIFVCLALSSCTPKTEHLLLAAKQGDLDEVQALLDRGLPVTTTDKDGTTALHMAARWGRDVVATILLDRGAPINAMDRDGLAPLHVAAKVHQETITRLLLDRGAEIAVTDRMGKTPLHVAAEWEADAVVRALLDRRAPINVPDRDGMTPLHVAAEWGAEGIARILLDSGAQVAVADRDGRTPLHQAARTTRRLSAGNGQLGVARLLMEHGASLDARTTSGAAPLHIAAEGGALDAAQFFVDHGASIEARTADELTPLHMAVKNGHAQVAQLLLDRGALPTAADRSGKTPLHLAAEQGREGLARLLVRSGATIGSIDAEGRTALHEPAGRGHAGVVRLLLAQGASPDTADKRGWTPLHMAAFHGHDPVVRLLVSHGAPVGVADGLGLTPLHAAAMYGYETVTRLLVEAGASPVAKDRRGLTPVDYARENGKSTVAQSLGLSAAAAIPVGSAEIALPDLPLVKVDGSSTVYPLSAAVADDYQSANHDAARVTIGISGTGGGFQKFCRGETDVQGASRPIATKEIEACKANGVGYVELPMAYDALSVVVSVNNTWADSVSLSELKSMWEPAAQGKVTLWSLIRPEWPAAPLKLYGAGADSGTFDYFTEAVVGQPKASRTDYTGSEDDNLLVEQIAESRFALGYIPYAYLEPNRRRLKVLAIDAGKGPVFPSRETVVSGDYQPLSRPMFIYVNHRATARSAVKQFVEFYLSHAARHAEAVRYVPFREEVYRATIEKFHQGKKGTVFAGRSAVGIRIEDILSQEAQS